MGISFSRIAMVVAAQLVFSAGAMAQGVPGGSTPEVAANPAGPASAGARAPVSGLVPEVVLKGAGFLTPEGLGAVERFLTSGQPDAQVIAQRATTAIRDLPGSGLYLDPGELLEAAANIAAMVPALCAGASGVNAGDIDGITDSLTQGDNGSSFGGGGVSSAVEDCLEVEEEIEQALAVMIAEVAPAAGLAEAERIDAVFEDGEAASQS